jgi:aminopeptidase N
VPSAPTPSLCRGFSAPVRVAFDYTPAQLALLLRHETEGFDRWNAAQQLAAIAFDEVLASDASPSKPGWVCWRNCSPRAGKPIPLCWPTC